MKYYLFFLLVILSSDVFSNARYTIDNKNLYTTPMQACKAYQASHTNLLKTPRVLRQNESTPIHQECLIENDENSCNSFKQIIKENNVDLNLVLTDENLVYFTAFLQDCNSQPYITIRVPIKKIFEKKTNDKCQNSKGAPTWHIDKTTNTLRVRDIPLWYQPSIGSEIKIDLRYKYLNPSSSIKNSFGTKWRFNYANYLSINEFISDKENVNFVIRYYSNNVEKFFTQTKNNSGWKDDQGRDNRLIQLNNDHFELHSENGEIITYNHKTEPSENESYLLLMTQQKDIHGNTITFDYDEDRMIGITDATGQRTQLFYNSENLVSRVEDPFGRNALFEYDQQSNLTSLTDMQGYTTTIGYDDNQKITFIEDAKGRTTFNKTQIGNSFSSHSGHTIFHETESTYSIVDPNGNTEQHILTQGHLIYINYYSYIPPKDYGKNEQRRTRISYIHGSSIGIGYPNGASILDKYDKNDRLIKKTNHLGETHKYTYNSKGKYLTVTNPLGQVTTYTYYPNDLDIKTITTANGTISYEYNDRRQVTKIDSNGQVIRYAYLDNGKIDSVTNALNQVTQYHYNDKHRLHSIKVEGKTIATYEYDKIGRKISETDLHGRKTTYAYNNIDTLVKITYPGGRTISREYNTCPRMLEAETLPSDRRYKYEYDAAKQLISKTDPLGGKVSYERDKNGNITTLIDKNQNRTAYEYNKVNQKTKLTYTDGTALKTTYDKGRITAITNGRGMQTSYGYNDKQQLSTISYTNEIGVSFVYDNGQLQEVTDAIGTHKYSYDKQGRLKSYDSPWSNDVIEYSYDPLGRTTGLTLNGKPYANYEYDILGRLTQVNDFNWDYDDTTPSVTLNYPNGIKHTTTLDEIGDIANRNYANEDITALNIDYGYNKAGELISEKSNRYYPLTTWFKLGLQKISQYNPLNQLITQHDLETPLVYDADGNLTEGYLADKTPFIASYDINNQLTSIRFKRDGIDYEELFRYFYTGMLASYELKENGTRTHYRQFLRLGTVEIQERNAQDQVVAQNLWNPTAPGGIGGLLERTVGAKQYYHYDHNGNPVQTVNAKGQVTDNLFYTPFGELINGTIDHTQPFGHSTKRGNFKSGLLYFGYRFYVPHMERWLNRDPIGTNGGLNIYAYVEQNPIMYVDPLGLVWETTDIDHHGVKNWAIGIANRLSSVSEGTIMNAHDFNGSTRDLTQQWRNHPDDPQNQRNSCMPNDPMQGDIRKIRQTFGHHKDPWTVDGKSWHWSPVVPSPTWNNLPK